MAQRLRVALAGLGSVSQRGILPHLAQPDAHEFIDTVACCDVVPGRAEETARKFGWQRAYTDYDAMINSDGIDAVLIATPIPAHFDQTMKALALKKHVYVQKSMTVTLAEANSVVEAATHAGVTVVASPGQMLRPLHQHIRDLVHSGALGKLYWVFTTNAGGGHENEAFRAGGDILSNVDPTWYYKAGGGPVYDMAVYSLHTLTGVLGPVQAVTALSGIGLKQRVWKDKTIDVEMDDNTLMLLDFGDSVFAVAGGQNAGVSRGIGWGRLAIFGTEGSIDVGGSVGGVEINAPKSVGQQLGLSGPTLLLTGSGGDLPHVTGAHRGIPESHVYADIAHLADCVSQGQRPVPSMEHARHVVDLIESAYRSARTGQRQTLTTTF